MDTAPDLPEQNHSAADDHPVLIVQNGRLSGTRRTLTVPLTLVGRKAGCDIRLNVDGVSALHCVLAAGPDGLFVRDLQSTSGTFVNEERVPNRVLHDGDMIGIGPFQFRVHLPKSLNPQTAPAEASQPEDEDALRIQVAAVAAQQAALTELESHLQRRKVALDQQEAQLADHLEDKRRRLVELRDEVRHGHASLKQDRAAQEAQVKELLNGLEAARQEAAEEQQQAQAERRRLVDLRVRLKRRWHRHWAGERASLKHRLAGVDQQQRRLESETERLRHERTKLDAAWARFNGEAELGRRQLQASWDALRQEKRQWQEMRDQETAELDQRSAGQAQREAALLEIQQQLAAERQHWERRRLTLEKEAEGLESRIRNQRRKLLDQEQEAARLEPVLRALEARVERKTNATGEETTAEFPAVPFAFPVSVAETTGSAAALSLHQEALAAAETGLQDPEAVEVGPVDPVGRPAVATGGAIPASGRGAAALATGAGQSRRGITRCVAPAPGARAGLAGPRTGTGANGESFVAAASGCRPSSPLSCRLAGAPGFSAGQLGG